MWNSTKIAKLEDHALLLLRADLQPRPVESSSDGNILEWVIRTLYRHTTSAKSERTQTPRSMAVGGHSYSNLRASTTMTPLQARSIVTECLQGVHTIVKDTICSGPVFPQNMLQPSGPKSAFSSMPTFCHTWLLLDIEGKDVQEREMPGWKVVMA